MYPGVIIEYDDQSDITSLPVTEVRNMPLFGAIFTSDKGTEEWTRISGKSFFDMYGKTISFNKHGQPLLQAAMTINAGGELFCKRLVADDATLANISIIAKLEKTETQAKDAEGNPIYLDESGNETTEVTATPKNVSSYKIKYSKKKIADIGKVTAVDATKRLTVDDYAKDIVEKVKNDLGDDEYLLYTIVDNGRGESKKRIKIIPNYKLSKSLEYCSYTFTILEGSSELETISFSASPSLVVNGENISLQSMINTHSNQLKCVENVSGLEDFAKAVATAAGKDEASMYTIDVLFGCNNKGEKLSGIEVDTSELDLQYTSGQALEEGKNGAFGSRPADIMADVSATNEELGSATTEPSAWGKVAIAALNGTFDKVIYNVDQYKIDAWVDANYPKSVKRAIETLAVFREDFMYFRDQGLGKTSYEAVAEECKSEARSMFVTGSYYQSYDVIDPYTKRQITVTAGYSIAQLLVSHLNVGSILPPAGIRYSFIIDDAIYGTVSHVPTICPDEKGGNEKEKFEELKVNYATYIDDKLVVESLYTSQDKNSQFSFVNNVMGIQEVVKAIRTKCPAIRYAFIDGEDLEKYKADVNEVIEPYSNNYRTLSLEYVADATYSANKIFYAVLKVVFKDFIQTEWFKITALSSVEVVSE